MSPKSPMPWVPLLLTAAALAAGAALRAQAPATSAPAKAADASPGALSFDRYHTPQEANAALVAINKANPERTALHRIATSRGGIDLLVLEIGPDAGKKTRSAPAVLVAANLEGVLPLTAEAALSLAGRLVADTNASRALTWFILPNGNPDAATRYSRKPILADERNAGAWNDDTDDQTDEDGPDDLDGNGLITEMRVKDPAGEWIPVDGEPRLMRKADASKGEKGTYKTYTEGIDNDGDGEYNEDPPGGTNVAVTFPHLFHPWTATAGRWPGSEPETFGLLKFAIDHAEIGMTFAFGASNLCLQPPAGGRQSTFDATAIKVPERIAQQFGADPNRTYSMPEILELVRPLAPPGFEITESLVASFLGLGAIVNPQDDDLKFYKELSEKYKEFLKANKLDARRLDPPQPKDGSFELWSYYHLGVPVFTMDFWTLPDVRTEEKEKSGITAESLESMAPDAFVALGEAKIAAFLKEVGAPDSVRPAMLLDGVKAGKMTPKQMAGMLKQLPKPNDATGADPKQKAQLAFSDKELQGKGFVAWAPYKHPTLGDVEIGGFVAYSDTTPPAAMIKTLVDGQVPWVLQLVQKLPHLKIAKTEAVARGAGVYAVTVWVENAGYLPFPTAMGRKNQHVGPAVLLFGGKDGAKGVTFLSGRARTPITEVDGGRSVKLEWVVQVAPAVTAVDLSLTSPTAWGDSGRIAFGAALAAASAGSTGQSATPREAAGQKPPAPATGAAAAKPPALPLGVAAVPIAVPLRFDRYYTYEQIGEALRVLHGAYPALTTLDVVGKSDEGRDIWAMTVNASKTGAAADKPGVYVDGNIHGNEIQAGEVCLGVLNRLLTGYGHNEQITRLVDRNVFYVIPSVNVDGRYHFFNDPNDPDSNRSIRIPKDDDRDGLVDEDGADDLDGDGNICQMRRKDPFGRYKTDPEDPRLMVRVKPGEKGEWTLLGGEGIDNDGDGKLNEDGEGYVDGNRNWGINWAPPYVQSGSGDYPFEASGMRAIARFIADRPNIIAVFAFHNNGGMYLRGPSTKAEEPMNSSDVAVYDVLGRNIEKIVPGYRYLVSWKDLYSTYGDFTDFTDNTVGAYSFVGELFVTDTETFRPPPRPGAPAAPSPDITDLLGTNVDQERERLKFSDYVTQGDLYKPWKPFTHAQFGEIEIGGWVKMSSRLPHPFMLNDLVHRNASAVLYAAGQTPQVSIDILPPEKAGADLYRVRVRLVNGGSIPTLSYTAVQRKLHPQDQLILSGAGLKVVAGGRVSGTPIETVAYKPSRPELQFLQVPGDGKVEFVFLVSGKGELAARYRSVKAGKVMKSVTLQ
jgi:hypothetical protein